MAAGVAAGGAAPPPNAAAGKAKPDSQRAQGDTPAGFAAVLGDAHPSAPSTPGGADTAGTTPADLPSEGPPDGDHDQTSPASAPAPDDEGLAEHILGLIGVLLPGSTARTGAAVPPQGGGTGHAPAGSRAGLAALPGLSGLPGLAQAAGPADIQATLAPAGNALALQTLAAGITADAAGLSPLPGLDAMASTADADPGASASLVAGQSAVPVRAPAAALPAALAAPLAMPADPGDGFDDGLGARIGWLAGQQLGRADIRLNPEHLGVIDLRLDLDGNRVSVELASASQDVRQALETSLGRLREMLGQQGLELARADVGAGQRDGGTGDNARAPAHATNIRDGESTGTDIAADTPPIPLRRHGLLDEYA